MSALIFITTAVVYVLASALLFLFGANLIRFAALVWRDGKPSTEKAIQPLPDDQLPAVTVQLPIYNELYVSQRVIEAACALDYPSHLLQIQVLDDSTDETVNVIARTVEEAAAQGANIVHIHRTDRTGYKAGALAEGLETASGEFVAIFDADFVPPADFLRRTVPHFAEPDVAFVQARWGHLNRDFSWLTRLQALAIDGHFLVEQAGRGLRGYWFNFNGTSGVWRKEAIADAGGWTADTLTEDLDLSYRAHLKGWRGQYLADLVVPGELPAQVTGFRRQQHRWARGSMECAIRLLPQVWRTNTSRANKFQASVHLMSYGIHLLLLLLTMIYPLVVLASVDLAGFSTLFGFGYLFALTSFAPGIFFIAGQRQAGNSWWREIPRIFVVTVFGSGLMVNTARAAVQIFTKPNPEFERTAKFGIETTDVRSSWTQKRYQLDIDRIVFLEFTLGLYSVFSAVMAYQHGNWGIFIYAVIFSAGLLAVTTATVAHSVLLYRTRAQRCAAVASEQKLWNQQPALSTK